MQSSVVVCYTREGETERIMKQTIDGGERIMSKNEESRHKKIDETASTNTRSIP